MLLRDPFFQTCCLLLSAQILIERRLRWVKRQLQDGDDEGLQVAHVLISLLKLNMLPCSETKFETEYAVTKWRRHAPCRATCSISLAPKPS
jgi:hypothetical protein